MLKKRIKRIRFILSIRPIKYVYYNYFCRNIVRKGKARIIPYRNAILDLKKGCRINLSGGDLEIGCDKLFGSKAETYVRLRENAVWNCDAGCKIAYGCTVEILKDALLDSLYFTMNSKSTMIAGHHITVGQDVMLARNVVVYDSDFHDLLNEQGEKINTPEEVVISNHVWIGTNSMILKGVHIKSDSVIAGGTIITSDVDSSTLAGNHHLINEIRSHINWRR